MHRQHRNQSCDLSPKENKRYVLAFQVELRSLSRALCLLIMEHEMNGSLQPSHTCGMRTYEMEPERWVELRVPCLMWNPEWLHFRRLWPLHYSQSCHDQRERQHLRSGLSLNPIWHPAYFIMSTALFKPLNDTNCHADIFKLQLTWICPDFHYAAFKLVPCPRQSNIEYKALS